MIKKLQLTLCLLCFCGNYWSQETYTSFDTAYYYYDSQQYQKAVDILSRILKKHQNDYQSNALMGYSLMLNENYEESIIYLNKALKLDSISDAAMIYDYRGVCHYFLGEFEKAISDFSFVIAVEPSYISCSFRGESYIRLERYSEALPDLILCESIKPDDLELKYSRGMTYYFLKQYPEALVDLEQYKSEGGDKLFLDYMLGDIYFNIQKYSTAITNLATYKKNEIDPNSKYKWDAVYKIGVSNYFEGNFAFAQLYLNDVLKRFPDHKNSLLFKGMCQIGQKDYTSAKSTIEKVYSKDPENSLVLLQMGILEINNNDLVKYSNYFEKSKQNAIQEKNDYVLTKLCENFILLGDSITGLECINLAHEANPQSRDVLESRIYLNSLLNKANQHIILSDYDKLISIFREFKEIRAYYIVLKCTALLNYGKYEESYKEINEAISLDPFIEYVAFRAYIQTCYYEATHKKGKIPKENQIQILEDIDKVINSRHRLAESYMLKTIILLSFDKKEEACEAIKEAIKLGVEIPSNQLKSICSKKNTKTDPKDQFRFNYNLSPVDNRIEF